MSRFTTCFRLARTNTLRLGSGKLFPKGKTQQSLYGPEYGGNMQNWEKSLRTLAITDEGYSFCQVDQAGAEALIVAYLCPPGRYRDLFLNGIKPHVYIGVFFPEHWEAQFPAVRDFARIPIAELKAHSQWPAFAKAVAASDNNPSATRYYYFYKQTCHSGNYGIMEGTFIENLLAKSGGKVSLTPQQGAKFLSTYRDVAFPELHTFHRYVQTQLESKGELRNLFGYPRRFRSLKADIKEAYAFIPQSTVGCITNLAVIRMQDHIWEHKLDWTILNNCHDSYLVQAPDAEIMECAKRMKEFIEIEMTAPRGEKFRMRSEASVGKNWGSWHEKKNPAGLKEVKI
jgi:hypothetical protein